MERRSKADLANRQRGKANMNRHRLKRAALFTGLVGLLIVGGIGLSVWRARRQEALNRHLIAVLLKGDVMRWQKVPYDYQEALSLVNAGADPNTPLKPLPAPSLRQLWNYLVHHSPLPVNHSPTAFLMVCGTWWTENEDTGSLHRRLSFEWNIHMLVDGRKPLPLIEAMLEHGANPELKDEHGWTPLINAVSRNDLKTVEVLLNHGADPNAKDEEGGSPLYWAMPPHVASLDVGDIKGTSGVVRSLLTHGADPNLPTYGGTLLQFAAKRPYLVAILKAAGAKK